MKLELDHFNVTYEKMGWLSYYLGFVYEFEQKKFDNFNFLKVQGIIKQIDYSYNEIISFIEKSSSNNLSIEEEKSIKNKESKSCEEFNPTLDQLFERFKSLEIEVLEYHLFAFYNTAFRIVEIFKFIPELKRKFHCEGVTLVRNKILIHPEKENLKKNGLTFSFFDYNIGPKFITTTQNTEKFIDKGFFKNVNEFFDNLNLVIDVEIDIAKKKFEFYIED